MGIPAPFGVGASGQPNKGDQANAVIAGTIKAIGPKKAFAFRGPMNFALWAAINASLATTAGSASAVVGSATGLAVGNAINSVNVPPGTTIGALSGTTVTLAFPQLTYPATFNNVTSTTYVQLPPGSNVAQLLGATVETPTNNEQVTVPSGTTVTAIIQTDIAPTNNSAGRPGIIQLSAAPTVTPATVGYETMLQFTLTGSAVTVTGTDTAATFTGAAIDYTGTVNIERSFDGGATWLLCNIGGSGQLAQYGAGGTGTPVSLTFGEPEKNVLYRVNAIAYTAVANTSLNYRFSQTGGAAESLAIGPLTSG